MNGSAGPAWLRAMQLGDVAALRKELLQLPDINDAWFAARNAPSFNLLGWSLFYDTRDNRILRCVLDAGADPTQSCRSGAFTNVLTFMYGGPHREIINQHERCTAQILILSGAPYRGTVFEYFAQYHYKKSYAVVWCFAHVLPQGARDIAFDFLKRFDELPWE